MLEIEDAIKLACDVHRNQKYGEHPYVMHVLRVMLVVPDDCKIAAVLHDSIEDQEHLDNKILKLNDIADEFGNEVGFVVATLTGHIAGETYSEYIDRICKAEGEVGRKAKIIKLGDLSDNIQNLPIGPRGGIRPGWGDLRKRYTKAHAQIWDALPIKDNPFIEDWLREVD